ncbi:hypothetical protein, partial [Caballeronia udeis]|uniref:hypothetical protein n=1 Tax=Caballeronia udeis TaxID=1232866 RepID=UPI001E42730F
ARGDKLRDVGCTCPRKNLDGPPQGVTQMFPSSQSTTGSRSETDAASVLERVCELAESVIFEAHLVACIAEMERRRCNV